MIVERPESDAAGAFLASNMMPVQNNVFGAHMMERLTP